MIAIVDYGVGNLFSLRCSLEYIGAECQITADPAAIKAADKIILPGVGAFGDAIAAFQATGLDQIVLEEASHGKPLMGICLGMQLLFEESCEHGNHKGLALIPGKIESLSEALSGQNCKVPHMGWNNLEIEHPHLLLRDCGKGNRETQDYVYYVHSYYAPVSEYTMAWSQYGGVRVTGLAAKDNVCGTQFHPEKSGGTGLAMLRAFAQS